MPIRIVKMHRFNDIDGSIEDYSWEGARIVYGKLHGKRPGYARYHRTITKASEFYSSLRAGRYAWPGGYENVFITSDGGCLCYPCALKERYNITQSIRQGFNDGWKVVGILNESETDGGITCDHCNLVVQEPYEESGTDGN